MRLEKLKLIKLLKNYSDNGGTRQDAENMIALEDIDALIDAILEVANLALYREDFKILYPESEVI